MKKKICLVTDWYPTKENPYMGCFFKEQAFAVSIDFDFIIFRYSERIRRKPFQQDKVFLCNKEKNTVEYKAIAYISILTSLADSIYNFRRKHFSDDCVEGVGRYVSERRKRVTKRKIARLFSKTGEEVDAFYCVDGQTEAFYLQCLSEIYKKPYVVGEHAPVPWPGSVISDVNKFAIEGASLYLAISQDKIRQLMLQNIKLPQTVYIGNMIDEEKLRIQPKNDRQIKTFIIVAAHSYYKNYEMFIKVMEKLTEISLKDFRILIVGYGANKGYSKGIEEFENAIRNTTFADKTELIREVSHEKMNEYYNRADAFVMTSIQEGQPVSAMEAACCGLPVFSTRCGGIEDYIDNENGRIYNMNDVEAMAKGLCDYLSGSIVFDPLTVRRKVVEKYGKDSFSAIFCSAFSGIINNN